MKKRSKPHPATKIFGTSFRLNCDPEHSPTMYVDYDGDDD